MNPHVIYDWPFRRTHATPRGPRCLGYRKNSCWRYLDSCAGWTTHTVPIRAHVNVDSTGITHTTTGWTTQTVPRNHVHGRESPPPPRASATLVAVNEFMHLPPASAPPPLFLSFLHLRHTCSRPPALHPTAPHAQPPAGSKCIIHPKIKRATLKTGGCVFRTKAVML